jgi:hypothetical protein
MAAANPTIVVGAQAIARPVPAAGRTMMSFTLGQVINVTTPEGSFRFVVTTAHGLLGYPTYATVQR